MLLTHPAYWRGALFSYNKTLEALCQLTWCISSFVGVQSYNQYEIKQNMYLPKWKWSRFIERFGWALSLETGGRSVGKQTFKVSVCICGLLLTTEVETVTQVEDVDVVPTWHQIRRHLRERPTLEISSTDDSGRHNLLCAILTYFLLESLPANIKSSMLQIDDILSLHVSLV